MTLREKMAKLSSAEDFFNFFNVPFNQAQVSVARLHILKRMGEYIQNSVAHEDEEYEYEVMRGHLLQAYLDFQKSTPIQERVFKVHKQAVQGTEAPLVNISI